MSLSFTCEGCGKDSNHHNHCDTCDSPICDKCVEEYDYCDSCDKKFCPQCEFNGYECETKKCTVEGCQEEECKEDMTYVIGFKYGKTYYAWLCSKHNKCLDCNRGKSLDARCVKCCMGLCISCVPEDVPYGSMKCKKCTSDQRWYMLKQIKDMFRY